MRAKLVGWGIGFVASWTMAGAMLLSTCSTPPSAPAPVPPRDPAKVSDVELELILNKVREGDLRALGNEMEAARRAWQEARRMGEGLWPIHEGLGDSFARAKLYDEAIREYQVAEPLVPAKHGAMKAGVMAKRGDALAAAGRPLEAIDVWLEIRQPGAVAARILGEAAKGERDEAVKKVARWAEIHDARTWLLAATLLTKLERKGEAAEALGKYAIAVAPWDGEINRKAIDGLRAAGKFDLAIEVCRAWVRSTPQALEVYRLMGDLHRQAGREKEALVAYSSIVDVRPGDAGAHRMLGEILQGMNRPDDAIAQFEAARKARPEDQQNYSTLISLYDAKGDAGRSEEVILEASKRFAQQGEFRSKLAATYQERIAKLKAEGRAEEVRAIRRKLAGFNVPEAGLFDLKIVMTWDARSDVDLDVYEPSGERVEHSHPRSQAGAVYYVDNTTAFGPETYTLPNAPAGTYRVGAHLHGDVRSTVKIVVLLFEDTPREERREGTFVLEKSGEQRFIPDIVISK